MTKAEVFSQFDLLPPEAQQEALAFIEELLTKHVRDRSEGSEPEPDGELPKRRRLVGAWEGKIWMADDFDEPLEDFAEYM